MDLKKRMRTNPFYDEAVKLLGHANYHLHRPDMGSAGSIDLIVYVTDKHGKETSRTFNLPPLMNGMAMMQWKVGFQRNIYDLERSGFRPSSKQFERLPETKLEKALVAEFNKNPEAKLDQVDLTTLEQIAQHEEFEGDDPVTAPIIPALVIPPTKKEEPRLRVNLVSTIGTLVTLLQLDERAVIADDIKVQSTVLVEQSRVSAFLEQVSQSEATLVGIRPLTAPVVPIEQVKPASPPPVEAPVETPFHELAITEKIVRYWPETKTRASVSDIVRAVKSREPNRYPNTKALQKKIGIALAGMVKNRKKKQVTRVGEGLYQKVG
jgi:hypothetical protein